MKKYILWSSLLMILVGSTLVSCHSDIDLKNVDTTSEVEMGLALPVGSISATIKDFIGNVPNLFMMEDEDENKGVIVWRDTFSITRSFHTIDVSQYSSNVSGFHMNVYDHISAFEQIGNNRRITGDGSQRSLDFDLNLKLSNFNNDPEGNERFDSILMNSAKFTSRITRSSSMPLEWDWIDSVVFDLGPQVRHPGGNLVTVYHKGDASAYGQDIPTTFRNFSMNFMIRKDLDPTNKMTLVYYHNNVVDTLAFKVHFYFTVPTGRQVDIPQDADFLYDLTVDNLDFAAAWGYFKPSKYMEEESIENIGENWGDLQFLQTAHTPFAKPEITVDVRTELAGVLQLFGDYLFSQAFDDSKQYATFLHNGQTTYSYVSDIRPSDCLDPYKDPIGAVTTKLRLPFSYKPEEGHLDSMFLKMPKNIGYKFHVDFDWTKSPQARVTPNDSIEAFAYCHLPLIFNEGLFISYQDTIKDVSIGQFSIDSLLKDVNVIDTMKATDLKLILQAENNIQFCVRAAFRCLDENNQVLKDPEDPSKDFLLFPEDTIRIAAPTFAQTGNVWYPTHPGETAIIASLNKAQLDMFPKIKSITYSVIVDDESIQDAYRRGLKNIRIKGTDALKLRIAITAHIDAMLNFNNNGDKNKQ